MKISGLWNEELRFNNLPLTKNSTVVYVGGNIHGADGKQILDLFNWYLLFIKTYSNIDKIVPSMCLSQFLPSTMSYQLPGLCIGQS